MTTPSTSATQHFAMTTFATTHDEITTSTPPASPVAAAPAAAMPAPAAQPAAPASRNFLARQRQRLDRLKPNGTAVTGPASLTTVTKSANGSRPLSTMRDGAARPRYSEPEAVTPQLRLGGKNTAGRHARDAADIAAEQLLGSSKQVAMPLPKLSPYPALPGAEVSDAGTLSEKLGSEAHFEEEVERLFPVAAGTPGATAARAARATLLTLLKGAATGPEARLAGAYERPVMLLYALAVVAPGRPEQALRELQRLTQPLALPGAPAVAAASTLAAAAAVAPASAGVDDPWRAAQTLAGSGGAAFEALKALAPPLPPHQTEPPQIYLETTAALRVAPAAADAIARLALSATTKLAQGAQQAELSEAEQDAHFNWRNNLREPGPRGDLALAQGALYKAVLWFNRAEERADSPWFDVMRLLGKHKTPIASLKHGTLGAHLDTDAKENAKFDAGLNRAIEGLGLALETQLASSADGVGAAQLALTVAKLQHWRGQLAAPSTDGVALAPEAARLTVRDGAAIVGAAQRLLQGARKPLALQALHSQRAGSLALAGAAQQLPAPLGALAVRMLQRQRVGQQAKLAGEGCTMETLQKWSAQLERDGAIETAYDGGMAEAQAALANLTLKPADMSPATVGEFFANYLQISPMGNRLRLFDGAAHGINNTAFPGLPVSPDARFVRLKQALLEINSHGAAIELAFGKQVTGRNHLGVAHSFGLAGEGPLQLGVSLGGNAGAEVGHFEGVRVRFVRELDANQAGTNAHKERSAAFARDMQQLATELKTTPMTPQQVWRRLLVAPRFDENMSVSWQHHPQQTSKVTGYARGGASLGGEALGGAYVGASAQGGGEVNPSIGLNRSERSGKLARTVVQMGYANRLTGRAGVGLAPPEGPAPNLLAISTTAAGSSVLATARAFEHAGRLKSDFIYRDVESEDPQAYRERMLENRPAWEAVLGKANFETRLAETEAGFQPNQRPAERWRLMESGARRFDAASSALRLREAALAQETRPQARADLTRECAQLTAEAKEVFANLGRWWEPVGTWNLEVNTKAKSPGLNLFAQMTIESGVSADRELSWIGASTAQMNAASNAFPAAPGAAVTAAVTAAPGAAKDTG